MQRSYVTNNHLVSKFNEIGGYFEDGNEVPEYLFIQFVQELGVSNLLIPGIIEDDTLSFDILTSDDESIDVLPLFSDDDAFIECYGEDSEFSPIANDIRLYIDLLNESEIDGILFNPDSLDFLLERDILVNLPLPPVIETDDEFEGYDGERLLNIAQEAANDSLIEFLKSDDDSFEALMLELQKSTLLNAVVSEEDLSVYAKNGVISSEDAGEFLLCTTGDDETQFGVLFTGTDAIRQGMDEESEMNCYCQVALLGEFLEFVLKSDMDGIIINPGSDDYLIGREALLEAYGGLALDNPAFKNARDYAFML